MKRSKQDYYDKYFEANINDIKNTWKRIKFPISLKTVASRVPTVYSQGNGDTITSLYDIANTFDNYSASIAETMQNYQAILQMKMLVQYFYTPLIKEK